MWSYLINSSSSDLKLLTFEHNNSTDLKCLTEGYRKLIIDKFFSSFSSEYDSIFVSEHCPNSNPQNKPKLFEMRFDNYKESNNKKVENNLKYI